MEITIQINSVRERVRPPLILLSDSCKSKFANEILRMKILRMASSLRKHQNYIPRKFVRIQYVDLQALASIYLIQKSCFLYIKARCNTRLDVRLRSKSAYFLITIHLSLVERAINILKLALL